MPSDAAPASLPRPSRLNALLLSLGGPGWSSLEPEKLLGEIFQNVEAEESQERKSVLRLACERFPSSQTLKLGLLRELLASGPVGEAGDLASALCLAEPPGEVDSSRIQQALMAAGRLEETVEFTRRAIEVHPGASHLRHNLGITLRNLGACRRRWKPSAGRLVLLLIPTPV
jgi:thioredoxin-like negative regulator of GroEL